MTQQEFLNLYPNLIPVVDEYNMHLEEWVMVYIRETYKNDTSDVKMPNVLYWLHNGQSVYRVELFMKYVNYANLDSQNIASYSTEKLTLLNHGRVLFHASLNTPSYESEVAEGDSTLSHVISQIEELCLHYNNDYQLVRKYIDVFKLSNQTGVSTWVMCNAQSENDVLQLAYTPKDEGKVQLLTRIHNARYTVKVEELLPPDLPSTLRTVVRDLYSALVFQWGRELTREEFYDAFEADKVTLDELFALIVRGIDTSKILFMYATSPADLRMYLSMGMDITMLRDVINDNYTRQIHNYTYQLIQGNLLFILDNCNAIYELSIPTLGLQPDTFVQHLERFGHLVTLVQ